MRLRSTLKWIILLFCIITTFQVVLGGIIFRITFLQYRSISGMELLEYLSISLAASLPTFILANVKPVSYIPLKIRQGLHFILTFSAVLFLLYLYNYDRFRANPIFSVFGAFLLIFLLTAALYLLVLHFYEKDAQKKETARRREQEERFLQYYTEEVERQYLNTRKFQHDYRNILLSIKDYLDEDDLMGLKDYYTTKIEKTSKGIIHNSFLLENLDKIKVREVKSLLVAKLMLVQDDIITTTFEAHEDIHYFPVDSVFLVRMLGIILDNAIEALDCIGQGNLSIGCFKTNDSLCFIVQNTCPPDMPPLYRLWEQGFSTKGANRGFGMSNLLEMVGSLPNVILETEIEEGNFIQKLIMTEDPSYSSFSMKERRSQS